MSDTQLLKIKEVDRIKYQYDLNDEQMQLLTYALLPKALRPHRSFIIGKLGITERQYYMWLRHPRFNDARREMTKGFYQDRIPDILMAMYNEAIAGNERAARLFLEYVDDWKKEQPEANTPVPLPPQEVNIIIQKLEQKFYGNNKPTEVRPVEGSAELVV